MKSPTLTAPKPLPRTEFPTDRAAIAAGFRHLADLIESEQVPIPTNLGQSLFVRGEPDEHAANARDLMRVLGGGKYDKEETGSYLLLNGMCGGVPIRLFIPRESVCERVVVGEEIVNVPAQPAVKARREVREVVEWRCHPLLAAADETAVEVSA